jgi:2-succinyl-5-enolpyruvyl-6-hydroxy-3-cyclohexene-1-carboxylate synthase
MISSNKKGVQLIVNQCVKHGMKHVVCSPGSRNAPFVIAFDEHPDITCYVIHDERSAAFFALGLAQMIDAPVGIVCTSGSAALNYYPAVAEAYYQCIPLVVITADRPVEWVDQGDGQTIVQKEVYKNHIRYACQFSENPQNEDEVWYIEREMAVAFSEGTTTWKGPIHFNVAFTEPLYGTTEIESEQGRIIERIKGEFHLSNKQAIQVIESLECQKILVICGQLPPDEGLFKELRFFAENSAIAVLVENTSNLVDMKFIHCIDRTLNTIDENEMESYSPDLLITIGGAVVSKKIKAFIRKNKPKQHWKVGYDFPYMDTFQSLTHTFETSPTSFFKELNLLTYKKNLSNFGAKWKQKDFMAQEKMPAFFETVLFSDISAIETILDYVPESANLHMSNSSIVRYCQLFDPIKSIRYWSNRGTSGIDGSSSTAVGAAAYGNKLHVLITGDVSFFYDSNALWNQYLNANLRIVLVNNFGGAIFKIIPGPNSSNQLEKYFEAKHDQNAEQICKAFNIDYFSASNKEAIDSQMSDFYSFEEDGRPKLIEVFTPSDINHLQLDAFFKAIK